MRDLLRALAGPGRPWLGETVDWTSTLGPGGESLPNSHPRHDQNRRSRADHEPWLCVVVRQRQAQHPSLMTRRYIGERKKVFAHRPVCRLENQWLIRRTQLDRADIFKENVDVIQACVTSTSVEHQLRVSNAVLPHPESKIKHDRDHASKHDVRPRLQGRPHGGPQRQRLETANLTEAGGGQRSGSSDRRRAVR
jgi:hypothetical protein